MSSEERYESLTLEEKMLVDEKVREWARKYGYIDIAIPKHLVELAIDVFIDEIERKETNDKRNRKQSASRRNNK